MKRLILFYLMLINMPVGAVWCEESDFQFLVIQVSTLLAVTRERPRRRCFKKFMAKIKQYARCSSDNKVGPSPN